MTTKTIPNLPTFDKLNTRQVQMWILLFMTGLSLVPIYWMIGWQTGGHGPDSVGQAFWTIEAYAWSFRGLVEVWALIYLFQTVTEGIHAKMLIAFEVALIALVGFTVGLVIVSNGNGQAISTGLASWLYWTWAFAVALFAPLMLGGVGFAYKVHIQPIDTDLQAELAKVQAERNQVESDLQAAETKVKSLASEVKAVESSLQAEAEARKQVESELQATRKQLKALEQFEPFTRKGDEAKRGKLETAVQLWPDMSQAGLAEIAGISRPTVKSWLNGKGGNQ